MLIHQVANSARENIQKVIVGKDEVIDLALVAVLCEGHILLEDVPGTGKTMLAQSVAATLGCTFRRIQFTPDLLPSDVTGINYFNQKLQEFEFRPGAVMSQVVLADEINRATPRTQSALLEAMQEQQVTVDGVTHPLPRPFPGNGYSESDRTGGHVSPAGGTGGSIPAQVVGRLSGRGGRTHHLAPF